MGAVLSLSGAWIPAWGQTIDELYEQAKTEKTLVLWGAGPAAGYESAVKTFEQRFPGIKVSLAGGFSMSSMRRSRSRSRPGRSRPIC